MYTSGATEAVHLATRYVAHAIANGVRPVVVTILLEHSSNDLPWRNIPGGGAHQFWPGNPKRRR
ncbi:MAG: hypothetical protein JXR76_23010 [Deltaproteobacteria bacterium]|nr:hypothetical protein [Deltaproteobacteria bacterium]